MVRFMLPAETSNKILAVLVASLCWFCGAFNNSILLLLLLMGSTDATGQYSAVGHPRSSQVNIKRKPLSSAASGKPIS